MPDQFLRRVMWTVNERLDAYDLNQTNDLAAENLALAIANFIAPSGGVVNGGGCSPAGGMLLTLKKLSAISGTDLIIIESDRTVGPFAANSDPNGYARLDLISVGYAEAASDPEQRTMINPDSEDTYGATLNTKVTANPVVTITQGVAAAVPVLPATPAGHIALYQVRIESGAAAITADKITQIAASRVDRVRQVSDAAGKVAVPWTGTALGLTVPDGATALLLGHLRGTPADMAHGVSWNPSGAAAYAMDPISLTIENAAVPNVALATSKIPCFATTILPTGAAPSEGLVLLALRGPVNYAQYRLRVLRDSTWFSLYAVWTSMYIDADLVAIV